MMSYAELVARWKALRGRESCIVREVACVGASRTLLSAEVGDSHGPTIALAAGMHGDEPAGVVALLGLVEDDALDSRYSYRIWPCVNPTGYERGTRENADGIDVNRTFGRGGGSPEARAVIMSNRDRKFALSIDLHEDSDANGFYCYEYGDCTLGERIVDAVQSAGFTCDAQRALRPDPHAEAAEIGGLSYSLLLVRNAASRVMTFETPGAGRLEDRVAMHRVAVTAALSDFSQMIV